MLKVDSLCYKVYAAARDGLAITVYAMLCNRKSSEIEAILCHKTTEEGQVTSPFIIAARNGNDAVVNILLTHFKVDIEQSGTVIFDGYEIDGATALWCAAGGGHYKTVKLLISAGADVNHATLSNSTPLRAACFDGRLDIVALLLQNNADLNIPNKYNNTCLMIACYKGHLDVVTHLLRKGADPDMIAHCGATALHFCAERGHLPMVDELMTAGAKVVKNDQQMTPLHMAAESGNADIVEYFVSRPECDQKERIEGLELLGASFANDRDIYDIERCYHYLWLAMQERFYHSDALLQKEKKDIVEAYEGRQECQDIKELESIKDDHNALHMEALMIRERILSEDNAEIPHHIIFRGAVFADTSRFDRCTGLWMRALKLRQKNGRPINKDLLRFAQVFSQMFHVGVSVDFVLAEEVFNHCLIELEKDQFRIKEDKVLDEVETAKDSFDMNVHTSLYLLAILAKIRCSKEEEFHLCRLAYRFNCLNLVLQSSPQYTPLHMICDANTLVDDFHVNDVVHFPSDTLIQLLLKCGTHPNQVDSDGNTPLHIIVKYPRPISDFMTLHNIIFLLFEAGAHLDRVNHARQMASEVATTGVAEIILRTKRQLSLKCIAARVIQRHAIPYKGHVPQTLNEFIEMH